MKPFTFSLMLLAQRVDEAIRFERLRRSPDSARLATLRRRRRRLGVRLARAFAPMLAGN